MDLGEVEDVVDERKEVPAAHQDVVDVFLLLVVDRPEHLILQHLGKSDHGVQRRPQFVAHVRQEVGLGKVVFFRSGAGVLQLDVLFLEHQVQAFALGHVTRRGENSLELPVTVVEGGGVEGDHRLGAVSGPGGEFVIGDLLFPQHQLDAGFGPIRIGEVILEGGPDQFVPGAARQYLHLLVDVGDDPRGIGGHDGVDVGFEQGPGVELMVPKPLA